MKVKSRTYIATPPGATIKEQLIDRDMNQKEFAARMGMSEKHISRLINGDVQLTPEMSVKLEMVLGVPAKFWNNLEATYREKLAKVKAENAMDHDIELVQLLPYNEMSKMGWVPETRKSAERVNHLRRYFEVVELPLLEDKQITKIACRRLAVTEKGDFALMAWAQRAKILARNIATAPININKLKSVLPDIRRMTRQKPVEFCNQLKQMLSDCGIALVFLPHLKGSFLQGATFIDGAKIVMGLTTRGIDADQFWFSLFHEIAHIVLGHIKQLDGTDEADEKKADQWARDILIPYDEMNEFIDKKEVNEFEICNFAGEMEIAPGIVVGRLQSDGILKHNMFNHLKEQYNIAV